MKNALDIFSWEGKVTRKEYLVAGLALSAFKYPLDLLVSTLFRRPWNPLMYFSLRLTPILSHAAPRSYLLALLAVALPFIAAGSLFRRDVCATWAKILFGPASLFLPVAHWAFILVLVGCPSRVAAPPGEHTSPYRAAEDRQPELDREPFASRLIPVGETGAFLLGLAASVFLGLASYVIAAQIDSSIGGALFLGVPFGMGFIMGYCVSHDRDVTAWHSVRCAFLPMGVGLLMLLSLGWEGIACIIMASPLLLGMTAIGAVLARASTRRRKIAAPTGVLGVALGPAWLALELLNPAGPDSLHRVRVLGDHPSSARGRMASADSDAPDRGCSRSRSSRSSPCPCVSASGESASVPRRAGVSPTAISWVASMNGAKGASSPPRSSENPRQIQRLVSAMSGSVELEPGPGDTTIVQGAIAYRLRPRPATYWSRWSNVFLRAIERRVLDHLKATVERPDAVRGASDAPAWMKDANETCPCTRREEANRARGSPRGPSFEARRAAAARSHARARLSNPPQHRRRQGARVHASWAPTGGRRSLN